MLILKQEKQKKKLNHWYKGYGGEVRLATNENGSEIMYTTFRFKWEGESLILTHAPQTWNRDKVVALLEDLIEKKDNWLKDYIDSSSQTFKIELVYKKVKSQLRKISKLCSTKKIWILFRLTLLRMKED